MKKNICLSGLLSKFLHFLSVLDVSRVLKDISGKPVFSQNLFKQNMFKESFVNTWQERFERKFEKIKHSSLVLGVPSQPPPPPK